MGSDHGFTLIELMITVAIIGVLAAVAIPAFTGYQNKAKATECQRGLASIRDMEQAYRAEMGEYGASLSTIGWMGLEPDGRYVYGVISATTNGFSARCSGNLDRDADMDIWTINAKGALVHSSID
ncbi:MAG: dolichyl-phosphate-mannose--protein mannosyltransferase [Alphaproteobacteria bacterium CG_4_10_14_0_2_um_filter_63_37]|nr:MAG: hypothetical protein AUJ55_05675 [Proteobacteria bacterium CG1_02_64_396]PJA25452.1 MAG: dolichyl-phosphate-mannose--protein mannosyltransferase [Alphaproteobacteria bacterium CG_4_10_14_0_2_um_filter_63_37]